MNLFSLGFKSDKDLQKYLSYGKIDISPNKSKQKPERKSTYTDSHLDYLIDDNNGKISMGIRDSNLPENYSDKDKREKNTEKKIEEEEEIQGEEKGDKIQKEEKGEEIQREEKEGDESTERKTSIVLDNKRTLFHKIFGPMEAGSIRGSIFNMVILSLGTGMFALPKYMSNTSLFFSCLLIISICFSVWWSLLLLSKACEKNNIYNYSKLIGLLYGNFFSIIYDTIVILYSFGVLILFNIIIYATLGEALYGIYYYKKYKTLKEFQNNSFWNEWYIQILLPYAASIIIVYPMCLIKDVSKLRIISLIGVLNIIFLILIVIYQSKDYIKKDNLENNVNYLDIKKGFKDKFDAFNFISTIFYASCFHIGCVPVINTLKNNVRRRIYKAIRRTILIDIFLYLSIAVIGYLSYPKNTPSLIIQRPTLNEGDSDIIMGLGKIGLVFTFFTKLPNTYASLRITLFDKIFGTTEITNMKNYIVTFIVIIICVTSSIVYKEISSYIKIMGGLFSTLVGFLFPSLLIVKSNKRKRYHWKNILTVGLYTLLTLIGFASSGLTVYYLIKGEDN